MKNRIKIHFYEVVFSALSVVLSSCSLNDTTFEYCLWKEKSKVNESTTLSIDSEFGKTFRSFIFFARKEYHHKLNNSNTFEDQIVTSLQGKGKTRQYAKRQDNVGLQDYLVYLELHSADNDLWELMYKKFLYKSDGEMGWYADFFLIWLEYSELIDRESYRKAYCTNQKRLGLTKEYMKTHRYQSSYEQQQLIIIPYIKEIVIPNMMKKDLAN